MRLTLLLPLLGLACYTVATERTPPSTFDRDVSPNPAVKVRAELAKRDDCGDGTSCILGNCCGDGCAVNCCGLDQGGVGCDMLETCEFVSGSVFIGCCGNLVGGCTGTPTMITIHTPYSTITFTTDDPVPTATEDTTTEDATPEPTALPTSTARPTSTIDDDVISSSSSSSDSSSTTPSFDWTVTGLTPAFPSTFPSMTLSLPTGAVDDAPLQNGAGADGVVRPGVGAMAALGAWFFF